MLSRLALLSLAVGVFAEERLQDHIVNPTFDGPLALAFQDELISFQSEVSLEAALGAYTLNVFEATAQEAWNEFFWETYWYGYESLLLKYPGVAPVPATTTEDPFLTVDPELRSLYSSVYQSLEADAEVLRDSVRVAVAEAQTPEAVGTAEATAEPVETGETGDAVETGVETGDAVESDAVETGEAETGDFETGEEVETGEATESGTATDETTAETSAETSAATTDETSAETSAETTTSGTAAGGGNATTTADNAAARAGFYVAGGAGFVALALV